MDFTDLWIFRTVAETGSMTKAAEQLGYVQPHVSARIQQLEHELHAPLLQRSNKGTTLLPKGVILLRYTEQIFSLLQQAKQELQETTPPLRLATTQAIVMSELKDRLLHTLDPCQCSIEKRQALLPQLLAREVDVIITYEALEHPAITQLHSTVIDIGLVQKKGVTCPDLANTRFFVSQDPHCPFRQHTEAFLQHHQLSLAQVHPVDSYAVIESYIQKEQGLAFLPLASETLELVPTEQAYPLTLYYYSLQAASLIVPEHLLLLDDTKYY
ncbi:LysR family transcriptional regulator [Fictibacillus macauensis ZFHKF-1]|uniref:LysR family transcriptional regulator n=1 Tax=Fictibacillus macauensis ZFHKF-1 TaxID=1196324 RepID=I8IWY8_9BACL|nr:LysR family transcriptional regulator [Fictibacillus macauensis]EIT83976.1 LysR family transcriptional regulator [Fictibacillus macauensis ZFHKF-1]